MQLHPKAVAGFLHRLAALDDREKCFLLSKISAQGCTETHSANIAFYIVPRTLFETYLQLSGNFGEVCYEVELVNAFFVYFASQSESKIPYAQCLQFLLSTKDWIILNKRTFDRASLIILLSYSKNEGLSEHELKLFAALIDSQVARELLYSERFCKSKHILAFLPYLLKEVKSIPLSCYLGWKMRKDIDQKALQAFESKIEDWNELRSLCSLSEESKQCHVQEFLIQVLQRRQIIGNGPILRHHFRILLTSALKYFGWLKTELGFTICDLQNIRAFMLREIAKHLACEDYRLLIPLCRNSEMQRVLFDVLRAETDLTKDQLSLIRFVNHLDESQAMPPLEKILDGTPYFMGPKTIREFGIYESRYPGSRWTEKYKEIIETARQIMHTYPLSESEREKGSAGLALLEARKQSEGDSRNGSC